MRIGINGSYLTAEQSGIRRYLVNLLRQWQHMNPEHEYEVYLRHPLPPDVAFNGDLVNTYPVRCPRPLNRWLIWENIFLASAVAWHGRPDVFFSPSYTLPVFLLAKRMVVTIYDVFYAAHPEWVPLKNRFLLPTLSRLAAKKADMILTGSEVDRAEIIRHFGVDPDKVRAVAGAAEEKFVPLRNGSVCKALKEKYRLPERFVLYVTHIYNRHMQDRVIGAVGQLQKRGINLGLVLIGRNVSHPRIPIEKIIAESTIPGTALWMRYLPEEDLVPMYNAAFCVISLTVCEGESLPLREAMACGVATIASPSLQEVVGDAGLIVEEPQAVDNIARAIERLACDEKLRRELAERGLERSRQFSWGRVARETMAAFSEVSS